MKLPEHLESIMGRMSGGWAERSFSRGVSVALFQNAPENSLNTYVTLGLENYALDVSGKQIRQIIMASVDTDQKAEDCVDLLLHLSEVVISERKGLLRGSVERLPRPVSQKSNLSHVYICNPISFPDDIFKYNIDICSGDPLIYAQALPITDAEADLIGIRGWRYFENVIYEGDIDLWNWTRHG